MCATVQDTPSGPTRMPNAAAIFKQLFGPL
jgi:hypothetical protein